jgi:2-alkenal reductase
MADWLSQLYEEMADSVAAVHDSLVHVGAGRGWRRGSGAGVVWNADGLLLTNAHVVRKADNVHVQFADGVKAQAQVIGVATNYDLALLQTPRTDLTPIKKGASQLVRSGDWVYASGHPWGVRGGVTHGVVIGAGANLPERPSEQEWIAVSLHYRPGHSGGPLFDAQGRVLGINTMMAGPDVGLAVPVHIAGRFVEKVLQTVRVAV